MIAALGAGGGGAPGALPAPARALAAWSAVRYARRRFGGGPRGGGGFAGPSAGRARPGRAVGAGGFLNATTPGTAVVRLLETDAGHYTWVAAALDSNAAAGYQLATDDPVMAIGGFNGTDPAPSLSQFEADVRAGKIHYFIAGGAGGFGAASTSASTADQITSWVENHFHARTVDGVTLYDLTSPTG